MGACCGFLGGASTTAVIVALVGRRSLVWTKPTSEFSSLGDPTYRIKRIEAPAAAGVLLKVLAAIIGGRGFVPQCIRRLIINDNKFDRMRALATLVADDDSGAFTPSLYPMKRLSQEQLAQHAKLASAAQAVVKVPGRCNSVLDYHEAFKCQRATPLHVLEAALKAIDALPPELQLFTSMAPRDALRAEAEASGQRHRAGKQLSVFDGVPIAVKDMVHVAGLNTTYGSHPSQGKIPDADDCIVVRLKKSGALVLGLTIMTEFGASPLGYSVHAAAPVNPYDTSRYCGGSSSAAGVGAALGIFPVALGFDGGGSIRIPAAMTGLIGLKTTWGRVPVQDGMSNCTVASGPLACTASDAALFYQLVAASEPGHFYEKLHGAVPLPPAHCARFNEVEELKGLRLGIFDEWLADSCKEVEARTRDVLAFLQTKGAEVVQISIPHLEIMQLAHAVSISAEFSCKHDRQASEHPGTLEPATLIQLSLSHAWSAAELLSAQWVRGWALAFFDKLFETERLSGIFMPTLPILPPKIPQAARATGESNSTLVVEIMKYMFPANLCGMPAVSIPAGLSQDGLPIAVQLMANHWDEHICLRVANALDVPRFRSVPPGYVDLLGLEVGAAA